MEKKLAVIVDNNEEITTGEMTSENEFSDSSDKNADKSHSLSSRKMCSSGTDVAVEMCSLESDDTC